ncbi:MULTISPECIES: ABC transporter permease [unclassified Chelatococcus]|uniref:ABC transporter permease n=1 Tax=unclassified Chelatococcus TaxID=2638111 RepID=UPI001BCBB52E|nr:MULTISPECIES: ABC transporter permease [unclassified Chelatococcus]CAH1656591.1 Dipeptide transport system permease protein DppC [Hyphomicrobiales bacterium]MBS7742433.1 ABC transporter permease [Chelatococcus sp. HY11]MBX3542449.1 ABC transporter permease [Chelatococcus sp.]MCO5075334.1 ABC transporter permease [Chelatococcus sp.]CAH1695876.1 Dipeptide transport system permease protein DppC [Hyphomicrobiales bacterium]
MTTALADPSTPVTVVRAAGYWTGVWHRLLRDPVSVACMVVLVLIIAAAILAPWLTSYDPSVGRVVNRLKPVGTPGHILGTDEQGRDMLTRLLYGGRLSLIMGIIPVCLALIIGGGLGTIAGFLGGRVNTAIMRATDVVFAFPSILLAVAIAGALGAGIANTLLALTVVLIPPLVRVTESAATQVRGYDFVDAARASGAGALTIIRVHVIGNIMGPVLVYASSQLSVAIIMAAGLSFIGLGAKPPAAEWGLMLNTLRAAIYSQPLLAALPGVLIFMVSLSFNLLSDGLRSAMEMK